MGETGERDASGEKCWSSGDKVSAGGVKWRRKRYQLNAVDGLEKLEGGREEEEKRAAATRRDSERKEQKRKKRHEMKKSRNGR